MRAIRWSLGILAALIVLATLAAWLVPPMLDWTRYRGEIVVLASGTLGRSVRIDGPISLTLLPQPVLTAAAVSVDEGEAAISVRVLRLRVALWPLLRGRIAARELIMRDFDMRVPWPITTQAEAVHRPDWLAATSARIEHGRVAIGQLAFTDIDADLATSTAAGGYAASGTARLSGRPWHFSMRMSQPGGDGSVALDVALDGQGPVQGVGATLSGQIDGEGTLGGRVTARGPDLSALLPGPEVAFKADGRLTIAGGLAAADDLNVDIGGSPARGAVALRVSPALRLDVALAASRLDLDAWLPTLLSGAGVPIPTGIDLSAEAAQLAGGTLRSLRGAFDIDAGGVDVRDVHAVLPGEASVRLSGRISHPAPGTPHFAGDATLAAPSLRTTLGWLEGAGFGSFSALPGGVLRSAALSGQVTLDPGQLAVGGLSGQIDGATVSGALAVRPGRRLALSASLQTDRIDLDPWLPSQTGPLAALVPPAAIDADVQLEAQQARLRGIDIRPFAIDGQIDGTRLTLRRIEGGALEAQFKASGTIVEGGRIADGRLDVQAKQAASLAALLPEAVLRRAPVLLRAPLALTIQADGPPDGIGLRIAADLGDLRLEAQPSVDLKSRRWGGPMTLRHPGAPRLAEMLGLAGAPAWLGDGSLALVAHVSGEGAGLSADAFDITAAALHASGRLALENLEGAPRVTGKIVAETLPLPLPYGRSPEPLPLGVLAGWTASVSVEAGRVLAGSSPVLDRVTATVSLLNQTLRIENLTGHLGGGALTGDLMLSAAGTAPALAVSVAVVQAPITGPVFDLPVDIVGGMLDGRVSLNATGFSPAALLSTLHGDGALMVRDGQFVGVDMQVLAGDLTEARLLAALAGGTTGFATMELVAAVDRGNVVLGASSLSGPSGVMAASGTVSLPSGTADLHLVLRPARNDPVEIGLRLTGPLDALRRAPELADFTRWRLSREQADPP